jgi:hypothetical protein
MSKADEREDSYLHDHKGLWRVSMAVPTDLRAILGTRMFKRLDTTSRATAIALKAPHVAAMKQLIKDAWLAHPSGGKKHDALRQAMEMANTDEEVFTSMSRERFASFVTEVCQEIEASSDYGDTHAKRSESAGLYRSVVLGEEVPIGMHLPAYAKRMIGSTKESVSTAVHRLSFWLVRNGRHPFLSEVSSDCVEKYSESYSGFFNARPGMKRDRIILDKYWEHLVDLGAAESNPFSVECPVPGARP